MESLIREKLAQAVRLVQDSDLDVWLTFVRETAEGGDPVLPLLVDGGLTWQSALMIASSGRKVAVVGNFDADPLRASGNWDEVTPYVQGIREPLRGALESLIPSTVSEPRIGVNFSTDDPKADGLTHGMFSLLEGYLEDSRFAGALVSAQSVVTSLRSRKTAGEIERLQRAIAETVRIFDAIPAWARVGVSERAIYWKVQATIDERGLGYGWDRAGNPIVNSGPDSMVGHGVPSETITLAPGHIFHIDLGVICDGYSSDIQRCWYVPRAGESALPEAVQRALEAVAGAIQAGADALRPGVPGWQVDETARSYVTGRGYDEYLHALGHQVGRVAHDGGGILGPRWERYGRTPLLPVEEDQVYTLELGVMVPEHGYLGLEEMVRVRASGCEWLTTPQREMMILP